MSVAVVWLEVRTQHMFPGRQDSAHLWSVSEDACHSEVHRGSTTVGMTERLRVLQGVYAPPMQRHRQTGDAQCSGGADDGVVASITGDELHSQQMSASRKDAQRGVAVVKLSLG